MNTHLAPQARTAPFDSEPGYYEPAQLWLYGNVRLLGSMLAAVQVDPGQLSATPAQMDEFERQAERLVLDGQTLVTGIHNGAHQRAAIVPLRWGAPRILVLSGGFCHHLGKDLKEEPFRTARLWRYQFDSHTDLVISRRAPDRLPTYALHNPTVDRLIQRIVNHEIPGCLFGNPEF